MLNGQALVRGENLHQRLPVQLIATVPVVRRLVVEPGRREEGGEDAVLGLREGGVAIAEKSGEGRVRGLQQSQLFEAGFDVQLLARERNGAGALLAATADERMGMLHAVADNPLPGFL